MAAIMCLIFLLLTGSRITTANHLDSEACADPSIPMTWEVVNLTVSSHANSTYYPDNNTVAAAYYIKFSIANNQVTWPQVCESEVIPTPPGHESADGDSGWLGCGMSNMPPEPEPTSTSSIQRTPIIDDGHIPWKDKILGLISRFQIPTGTPYGLNPVHDDVHPSGVMREQTGRDSNQIQVPKGSPTGQDPVDDQGHPLAVIRAQTPASRPAIQDYGAGRFRFNRSSGVLSITQRWGCYENNETELILNYNATGSTNISDFSCTPSPTTSNDPSIPRPPVRLPVNRDKHAGTSDIVTDDDPSDGVIYDCVPAMQTITVIPDELQAWGVDANDSCFWKNDCVTPGE
ncbi:hypothetical protein V8F06_008490 [Rhypophila decipiens]